MDKLDILHGDVKEIKHDVKELIKLAASHNIILQEHEKRSTQLEERFKPIEDTYIFAAKCAVALGILSATAGVIKVILELRAG